MAAKIIGKVFNPHELPEQNGKGKLYGFSIEGVSLLVKQKTELPPEGVPVVAVFESRYVEAKKLFVHWLSFWEPLRV